MHLQEECSHLKQDNFKNVVLIKIQVFLSKVPKTNLEGHPQIKTLVRILFVYRPSIYMKLLTKMKHQKVTML